MAQSGGAQIVGNIGMYYAAYRLSQQGAQFLLCSEGLMSILDVQAWIRCSA